ATFARVNAQAHQMEHKGHTVISSRQCRSFSTVFCTTPRRGLPAIRNAEFRDGISEGIPVPRSGPSLASRQSGDAAEQFDQRTGAPFGLARGASLGARSAATLHDRTAVSSEHALPALSR